MYYTFLFCVASAIHGYEREIFTMALQNTFSVRLDDETTAMLNELKKLFNTDANNLGINSTVSRTQIIKDAIKAYYSQKLNLSGNSESVYLDLMRDSVQQVVEPMLQGSTQILSEQLEAIQKAMLKLSLQMKLELYAQNADSISEEEIISFLKSDYSYSKAINKYALALINGVDSENSENE